MKKVSTILLIIATLLLAYMSYRSIAIPENFKKEQGRRELRIQKQLKQIAGVQDAYKLVHGRYASFEELQAFLENGRVYVVNAVGDYTDAMREEGLSEKEAAAKGLITRDTIWMPARDTLLHKNQTIENLLFVDGFPNERVLIDTATVAQEIGTETVHSPVFRAAVPMELYLNDMDKKILADKIREAKARYGGQGYPGLAIGSLTEVKNTGNWE